MLKHVCILLLLFSSISAEDILFVKGGEVEGVYVGSFYLAKEKITNQDYFLFIQEDGYNKRYLWDAGTLEEFEKQFTIKSGDKAPRSWKEGNPPVGKEYEPVLKITKMEARAFAKNKGWIIPTRRMWQLAQKSSPEIGAYPWEEDYEDEENTKAIYLARYFIPGNIAEQRFQNTQKEIQSFASVSQVNRNASSIRDLDRKFKKVRSSVKDMERSVSDVLENMANNDRQKDLEKLVSLLNTKMAELEKRQKEQVEKNMKEWAAKQDASANKIKDLTSLVVSNTKEVEALRKSYQKVDTENQELKKQLESMKKAAVITKKIDSLQQQVNAQKARLDSSENTYKSMSSQANANMKASIENFKNEQQRWLLSQEKQFDQKTKGWQSQFSQLDELGKETTELKKQVKRLNSLCPPLPNGSNYVQNFLTLKSGFDEVNLSVKKAQTDLNFLQQKDISFEQRLSELKKQDENLAKEDSKLTNNIKNIRARDDIQDKDIAKLDALCRQLEKKANQLQKDADLLYKSDSDFGNKWKNLLSSVNAHSQEDANLRQQIEDVGTQVKRQSDDIAAVNRSINQLKNKDATIDKSLKETTDLLRGESQNLRKKLYDAQQSELKFISESSNKNAAEIKGLESYIGNLKSRLQTKIDTLETDLKLVEKRRSQLETDFRVAATQMRHNMLEVGQKMLQLFQKGMFIGPIPPEKEIHKKDLPKEQQQPKQPQPQQPQNLQFTKEQKEKLKAEILAAEKIENQKIQEKVTQSVMQSVKQSVMQDIRQNVQQSVMQDVKQSVMKDVNQIVQQQKSNLTNSVYNSLSHTNNRNLSELCFEAAKIFFKKQQTEVAYGFTQLSLKYNKNVAQKFWEENWIELSTPREMVYIPEATAILGKLNDYEYPYRKKAIPAFFMDRYEVTREQFAEFVKKAYGKREFWSKEGNNWRIGRTEPKNWRIPNVQELNLPAVNVNYYEAEAYAKWQGKRLPTADEWERAARYKDGRLYPWGNKPPREGKYFRTNFRQIGSYKDKFILSAPVGSFEGDRSVEGIYDLCGNVAEWCSDAYRKSKTEKAVKGGSFSSTRHRLQGHYQTGLEAERGASHIGFRCVKDTPNK